MFDDSIGNVLPLIFPNPSGKVGNNRYFWASDTTKWSDISFQSFVFTWFAYFRQSLLIKDTNSFTFTEHPCKNWGYGSYLNLTLPRSFTFSQIYYCSWAYKWYITNKNVHFIPNQVNNLSAISIRKKSYFKFEFLLLDSWSAGNANVVILESKMTWIQGKGCACKFWN